MFKPPSRVFNWQSNNFTDFTSKPRIYFFQDTCFKRGYMRDAIEALRFVYVELTVPVDLSRWAMESTFEKLGLEPTGSCVTLSTLSSKVFNVISLFQMKSNIINLSSWSNYHVTTLVKIAAEHLVTRNIYVRRRVEYARFFDYILGNYTIHFQAHQIHIQWLNQFN